MTDIDRFYDLLAVLKTLPDQGRPLETTLAAMFGRLAELTFSLSLENTADLSLKFPELYVLAPMRSARALSHHFGAAWPPFQPCRSNCFFT